MSCRGWLLGTTVGLIVGVSWSGAAHAQALSPEDQLAKSYRNLATSCVADTKRFCPGSVQSSRLARDQFMCLKIYRADLTLSCRKAVSAVSTVLQPTSDHGS